MYCMATKYYLAIADRHPDESSWSIIFPDFPGVTSVATKFADVMHQAKDALATAVEDMAHEGEILPPSVEEDALPDYDRTGLSDPRTLLVPVETMGRALRVNVSLEEGLLARIDDVSKRTGISRSALLARGARMLIAAEMNP
jgi:predicted RNase H-like HicB family nuclease